MRIRANIPWPRVLGEGAIIVVSILLAFGIQAWWESRQQDAEERLLLGELSEEFRQIRATLEYQTNFNEAILEAAKFLLSASHSSDATISAEKMDHLLYDLYWSAAVSVWDAPVLESLLAGGDFSIVSNSTLRTELARWATRFDSIQAMIMGDREYFFQTFEPYFIEHIDMPQVNSSKGSLPGQPEGSYGVLDFRPDVTTDHRSLLGDQKFENIVSARAEWIVSILGTYDGVDEKLVATINEIDSEIER